MGQSVCISVIKKFSTKDNLWTIHLSLIRQNAVKYGSTELSFWSVNIGLKELSVKGVNGIPYLTMLLGTNRVAIRRLPDKMQI